MDATPDLYIVVKQRDARGKWERTGKDTEDCFLDRQKAVDRVLTYKNNVPGWRFAYQLYRNGKPVEMMGV